MDQNDALHKERKAALLRATKYAKHDNGLYLGSVGAANNKTLLTSYNVTHILTVTNLLPPAYPNDFTYKIINVSDRKEVNIAYFFNDCFNFINQ
nr:dual specificity protein phosphatase 1 [Tanacetum cinerariifolium]